MNYYIIYLFYRQRERSALILFFYISVPVLNLANPARFGYACRWEWLGPGGLPGLQHRWRVALRAAVGSTPIHSRLESISLIGEG